MTSGQQKEFCCLNPILRARQPEQKEERRRTIIEAALVQWRGSTFEEFTMTQLASRLGLAKGTLYLYFETKEALFLAVLEQLLEDWLQELAGTFRNLRRPVKPRAIAEAVVDSIQTRRELVRLLPLVETLLDRSASDEKALDFERRALAYISHAGQALEDCFPVMPPGSGLRLVLLVRALLMGLYLRANKPSRIRQMMTEHAELRVFDVRFDQEFAFAAEALIEGFLKLTKREQNLRSK